MELFITIHKQKVINFLISLEFSLQFVCKHHFLTFPAPCRWRGMDTFLLADSLLNVFFTLLLLLLLLLFWYGFLVKFSFLVSSSNSPSFFSFLTSSSGVSWLSIPCSACLCSPSCWKRHQRNWKEWGNKRSWREWRNQICKEMMKKEENKDTKEIATNEDIKEIANNGENIWTKPQLLDQMMQQQLVLVWLQT